jgi:hypothetical protein
MWFTLTNFAFSFLQCVPYGIAAIWHNACEHYHRVSSLSLVSTGDEIFSSMLYQCWMSSATFHYPPRHELLRLEEFQLFLIRFLGKDVADFYQVSPCKRQGVQGIDLFLGEPLTWMMLQACLGQIAIQAYATFLGKFFELRPDFIRTSEGCTLDGGFLIMFFFFMSMTIDERDEIINS